MKQRLFLISLIVASLAVCPCAVFLNCEEEKATPALAENEKTISVMLTDSGKTEKTKMREYIIGCVAAEMSPFCHSEALKAQAVASYTYAMYVTDNSGKSISDSPDSHQGYLSEKERREKWKENYDKYEKKIEDAVDAVSGQIITYNGKTALTVYHSICIGKTQSALNMWGEDYPYLQSAESSGDILSPDRVTHHSFKEAEYVDILEKNGITPSKNAEENVGKISLNSDGYASEIEINGKAVSASDFRKMFKLESTCFEIEYSDEEYIVTCNGSGHGVGMSQYGADYMARQGSTWREIIEHYYSGAEITTE